MRLRTLFTIGAVGGLSALGLAANLPAHAAGPGTGNCVAADGAPTPPPDASSQALPDGGTLYHWGTTSGGVEAVGPHGWIAAQGDATGPSGSISGYSNDAPVNGSVGGSPTSPSVCISVGGQKVTAP
jgi:hypothetical protein